MTEITVDIMVEVLTVVGTATKEVKRGRISELIAHWFFTLIDQVLSRKVSKEVDGKLRH
jgi:hypothetical protein